MSDGRMEVVTVPDFSGDAVHVFTARTLFFLASWLERHGEGRAAGDAPRVRLCCIGEPPASVRRLAARAGAEIGVHTPVEGFWGGFANKLRGLEGTEPGQRCLLLDADVLALGDLRGLEEMPADFAAAPAGKPQVPQGVWETIYTKLGMALPGERMPSLRGRLGLGLQAVNHRYEGQQEEAAAMLPYYNSGVLLARGGCGLRERWEEHLRRVLALAMGTPETAALLALTHGDQVGLVTALESLRAEGRTFALLPDACNARLVHLRAGAMRWPDIALFHATGFLRDLRTPGDLPAALEAYVVRWTQAIREGEAARPRTDGGDAEQPRRLLAGLWERWVRPEWERA